jgi:hypothetical protein
VSADLLAALGALHQPGDNLTQGRWCRECGAHWPCRTTRVIAAHQPAEPEIGGWFCRSCGASQVDHIVGERDGLITHVWEPEWRPAAHQSERTDTAEARLPDQYGPGTVPHLLVALQDAVNRAREDRAAQPSEPERGER